MEAYNKAFLTEFETIIKSHPQLFNRNKAYLLLKRIPFRVRFCLWILASFAPAVFLAWHFGAGAGIVTKILTTLTIIVPTMILWFYFSIVEKKQERQWLSIAKNLGIEERHWIAINLRDFHKSAHYTSLINNIGCGKEYIVNKPSKQARNIISKDLKLQIECLQYIFNKGQFSLCRDIGFIESLAKSGERCAESNIEKQRLDQIIAHL